jgi:excisionase family DNA binding protein
MPRPEGTAVNALDLLSPALRHEIEVLVDERVAQALRRVEPKRWMRVPEAAAYLGCTEVALRSQIKRDRVPIRHSGRTVLIDRVALDRLIEED